MPALLDSRESGFARLGRAVVAHRWAVLGIWAAVTLASGGAARLLPSVVVAGSGSVEGSASERVEQVLEQEFAALSVEPLLVAMASERYRVSDPVFAGWLTAVATRLRGVPGVRAVTGDDAVEDRHLDAPSSRRAVLLVDLQASGTAERERMVPLLRAAMADQRAAMHSIDPTAQLALTGQAATAVDINAANQIQGDEAERKALPLTLLVLVAIFGAVAATGLPIVMGVSTTLIALGIAWALAHALPVSNLLQNIVTMLGLALGIDYSLLIVSRLRERLAQSGFDEALVAVMAEEGPTVALSGATVLVGLSGLLLSPLLEMRSLGLGGVIVVTVAVLAALTLLPALLSLLGTRLEWPQALSRRFTGARERRLWDALAARVVARPLVTLLVAATLAVALALPGLAARIGFDNDPRALPHAMQSRIGLEIVGAMGRANSSLPINLVLRARDGRPALNPSNAARLRELHARLARDGRVAMVLSPFAGSVEAALAIDRTRISRDARAVLFQVVANDSLSLVAVQALARELGGLDVGTEFAVAAGGPAVYYNDYEAAMAEGMVRALAVVILGTALLLFLAFRSWLLPLKAVLTNLLAVAAGFGAVVAVFQLGWCASWLGVEHRFTAIPLAVPLLLFCLSFGLSMDYEVFLLRRIRQHYLECRDNSLATRRGMTGTGPVISGAASIMALVFAAFTGVDIAILQMLGLGLSATIVVDALLIRALLVPAIMCLAGRWNWLPGLRQAA